MDDIHARIDQMAARLALLERQVEALAGQTLPAESLWRGQPALRPDRQPATAACTGSRACRQADFETPWFSYWAEALGAHPAYHRKLWEVVYICQALHERGLLTEGRRGLGFGVGREPLACLRLGGVRSPRRTRLPKPPQRPDGPTRASTPSASAPSNAPTSVPSTGSNRR